MPRFALDRAFGRGFAAFVFVLVFAGALAAQSDLDKQARTELEAAMGLLKNMSGDMKDDERKAKMMEYQQGMRRFVEKYEPLSEQMTDGKFDLGRAYLFIADPASAEKHFRKFLEVAAQSPDAEQAQMLLADALGSMNRNEEAAKIYEKLIAANPDGEKAPDVHLQLGRSRLFLLDFDGAIAEMKLVRTKYPEHRAAADSTMMLINAYEFSDRPAEARALLKDLLTQQKEAPELQRRMKVFEVYGTEAPDLVNVERWIGVEGSNISRLRDRVVVLCFFAKMYVNCARELQILSEIEGDLGGKGLTVWGVTKTYNVKKDDPESWTIDDEAAWLKRYRSDPRYVLLRELKAPKPATEEERKNWETLAQPITVSFALGTDFANHKNYNVRGVPYIVVIDKAGKIRFVQEGGGAKEDFPHRVLRKVIDRLMSE